MAKERKISMSIYQIKYLKTVYKQRYTHKVVYRQRFKKRIKSYMRKGKLVRAHTRRVWKKVKTKKRYWHKVTKERAIITYKTKRFDFYGSKEEIKKVVRKCFEEGWIPRKRFVRGSAKKFLETPEKYGYPVRE